MCVPYSAISSRCMRYKSWPPLSQIVVPSALVAITYYVIAYAQTYVRDNMFNVIFYIYIQYLSSNFQTVSWTTNVYISLLSFACVEESLPEAEGLSWSLRKQQFAQRAHVRDLTVLRGNRVINHASLIAGICLLPLYGKAE